MNLTGKNILMPLILSLNAALTAAQPAVPVQSVSIPVTDSVPRLSGKSGVTDLFSRSRLKIYPASTSQPKGSILFFPDGSFDRPETAAADGEARFFTRNGYTVLLADFIVRDKTVAHDAAIRFGIGAVRWWNKSQLRSAWKSPELLIAGTKSGGHIAAEVVRRLSKEEQPAFLILTDPTGMGEQVPGTVLPAVRPPLQPTAQLLLIWQQSDTIEKAASEIYAKTWQGYDGPMATMRFPAETSSVNHLRELAVLDFIAIDRRVKPADKNPAEIPVAGGAPDRHREKLDSLKGHRYDLLMIGNSITNNFDKPEYQPVWQQFFASRNAINLGYSGYRTENILWNLDNGELQGQQPKVAVIEIGTNNVDEKHYPTRHTAEQLAGGIKAIVQRVRDASPDTKIIVLRCFPGSYDGAKPTSHRAILERASDIVARSADNEHVFYCDVNHVFLKLDGSVNQQLMPDFLHPGPEGARAWARAMEPLLSKLMGDSSRDTEIPTNTAIVPATKLEEDSYNWWDRHAEVLRIKDSLDPQVVLIGNSITHFWGGLPLLRDQNGALREPNGPVSYANAFGRYRVLNLGFGWDRTQNVLWRLDHGELDGLHPGTVVIDIGTNNTSETSHARRNTPEEIVAGIDAVCRRVRSKVPGAHLVVMAVFPREEDPENPRRKMIAEINRLLKKYTEENALTFIDIGPDMLEKDGHFKPGMMRDFTHPAEKGYQVWADHLRDILREP